MAIKYMSNLDVDKGINKLLPARKVAWSTGRNVRFTPGYVSKTLGKDNLGTSPGGAPIRAIFPFIGTDGVSRFIVCCDTVIYSLDSEVTTFTDITPAGAPTGDESDVWQFELVGGLPILTNGKDAIWKWTNYAGILTTLTGAPTYAKRMSSCMNRLILSNLSEDGYAYTGRVRWTEMGNPEYWTIATDLKAGRFDLMNYDSGVAAYENIKAQVAVGHQLYFWTDRNIWGCDFSQVIKQFLIVGKDVELYHPKAICRKKDMVYFIGRDDLYTFNGGRVTPIGAPIREDLFDNINESALDVMFSFAPHGTKEIWFCIATGTSTVPDTAYVFNYELEVWTIVDVDFLCHSESDIDGVSLLISKDIVGNPVGEVLQFDSGYNQPYGGTTSPILGTIETGDMDLESPDMQKRVSDVFAELELQDEITELMIQVGFRRRLADDLVWSDPVPFTIGVSDFCDFCDFRKEGKYVRLRFFSDVLDSPWKLLGYTIKFELGGTR